jgi:predicted nucleic-acid-binding protein
MVKKPKQEENNPRTKAAFLEVVDNQLTANDPPETRQTLDRLIAQGISPEDAKIHIAQAVCLEVFNVLKQNKPSDQTRYVRNLQRFPKEPKE